MPTRQYLRDHLKTKDFSKIRLVENGIAFEDLPEAKTPTEIRKICCLGRIDPRKGQLYALEAADLLLERNTDLEFTLVGSSVPQDPNTVKYEQQLRDFVAKRNLNNVTFKPEVNDPFTEMLQHDCILVLPTEPETFGRVVTEALSMGKLVIAFDQTGPREIMQSFETYLKKQDIHIKPKFCLTEAGNAMSLAEKIGYFADNPNANQDFTSHARAFVQKTYNLTETKKRLVAVLIDLP